jgi:hypothetical protein
MTRKLEELFELPPSEDAPAADAGTPLLQKTCVANYKP